MTFRAGFSFVHFRPILDSETAGKLQSVRRKELIFAHFEAPELSYPILTFPGPFWNLQNHGSSIEKKAKIHTQVPPRFHLSWTGFHLSWTGSQVGRVGFGSIWEEILTKWLENGPYELIFGPFGTESWLRVRFWGSRRPKMASFGGSPKNAKIADF